MEESLRDKLYNAIAASGYESSWARTFDGRPEVRYFSPHHIDAILEAILPIIEPIEETTWRHGDICQ